MIARCLKHSALPQAGLNPDAGKPNRCHRACTQCFVNVYRVGACDWLESCQETGAACHAFKVYEVTGTYDPRDRGLEPLSDDQYPEL